MAHPVVEENEGGHRLDDGYGSGDHTRVVAAFAHQLGFVAFLIDGGLGANDGGGGFKAYFEIQFLAGADTAENSAGVIGAGADFAILIVEEVVVFASAQEGAVESAPHGKAFGGGKGEHGFGEIGLEPVENRIPQAYRQPLHAAEDQAAHGIAFLADFKNTFLHFLGGFRMGAADRIGFDFLQGWKVVHGGHGNVVDTGDIGPDVHAAGGQDFAGNGGGGDSRGGFPGRRTAASLGVTVSVFGLVGKVGVGGPEFLPHLVVGFGLLVAIGDIEADGRSGGAALVNPGEDFDLILLVALGNDFGLSGATAIQFFLQIAFFQGKIRGATIHDGSEGRTMTFTPGGDTKNFTESIGHG